MSLDDMNTANKGNKPVSLPKYKKKLKGLVFFFSLFHKNSA